MAAYGLYSHIQSNRRRSIVLLAGLFFLVYVLVYAGALVAEALSVNADLNTLMQLAWIDLLKAAPFATVGTALWIVIAYYFHQSMIDALTGGREVTAQGAAAALQYPGKSLHLARHPDAQAQNHRIRRAQCLRHRHERQAIFDHRHHRPAQAAQRRRNRIRARPRADAYPQRRRPHDGHRRHHRRRDFVLRRAGFPAVVLQRLQLPRRGPTSAAAAARASRS